MLISYRGFKELALIAGSSGDVWALDADLERLFWSRHLDSPSGPSSCSGDLAAIPALTPPMNFARRPRPAPVAAARPAASPGRVGGTGFGVTRSIFALAGDGTLHQLNSADGSDQFPPLPFLPPNSKASSLTLQDGVLYTTTGSGCGRPNAVWAIDLNDADPKPVSFVSKEGAAGGIGGFALGSDGTVYVPTEKSLLALTPKDLKLKSLTIPGSSSVTPVVFTWKDKEMVVSAGNDGRLYLLAQSLGGADDKTSLYKTAPIATGNPGIWGGLSSWEDGDGTRWVLAPVWGKVAPELNTSATNGAIVAFKLEESNGKPVLTPAWVSRDMSSPEPPVITSGVVFALSAGAPHATLYALDGATGKEMYSTGNQVSAPGNLTGVTVANGRVYFTTTDSTVYAFGIYLER
jgi:outer membrane protein assembly factor BamB